MSGGEAYEIFLDQAALARLGVTQQDLEGLTLAEVVLYVAPKLAADKNAGFVNVDQTPFIQCGCGEQLDFVCTGNRKTNSSGLWRSISPRRWLFKVLNRFRP
jgi:hypothetical protein